MKLTEEKIDEMAEVFLLYVDDWLKEQK